MANEFSLDVSSIPKELLLILELLRADSNGNRINHSLIADIDWDRFLELTSHHRVYPMVYKRLKELIELNIPTRVIHILFQQYQKNTFQMLHLSGEMEHLFIRFNEGNIRALLLKGPILAASLYGDVSLRTSRDLDLLIQIQDLGRTERILEELGYVKEDYFSTVLNDWKWRHHHVTYLHPLKRINLELHWRLNPGPSFEPKFNELWERKRRSTLTSYPVYYLGSEDLFLFLVAHGARHGWSRLRWLTDIQQMVKQRQLDWGQVISLLRKYQCLHVGGQAILLASELLHSPISGQMNALIEGNRPKKLAHNAIFYIKQMVNLHTYPLPKEIASYHKRHLFSLMSMQQKLLFIMSFLYPYPQDAETLPLPKYLHFLYFPLRPLLWAWRKTIKHALP